MENKKRIQKINLDHVNFTTGNFTETAKWYKDIFDFEVVEMGENSEGQQWGILKNGNSMLAVSESDKLPIEKESTTHKIYHFGFQISDELSWLETISKFHLKTYFNSPVKYPHSTSWYVKDPTGYTIEVSLWNNNRISFDHEISSL